MRNTVKNYMLGMALVAGLFGTGVVAANAAPQEFHGRIEHGPERGFNRGYDGRVYGRPEVRRDFDRREFVRPIGGPVYGGGYGVGYANTYIPPCPVTAISGQPGTTTAGYGFLERGVFADGSGSIADTAMGVGTGTTVSLPNGVVVNDSRADSTDAVNLKS